MRKNQVTVSWDRLKPQFWANGILHSAHEIHYLFYPRGCIFSVVNIQGIAAAHSQATRAQILRAPILNFLPPFPLGTPLDPWLCSSARKQ